MWDYFYFDSQSPPQPTTSHNGLLNSIADLTVDGITIIDEQVPYVGSHTETAAALAKMINDSRSAPG